MFSSLFGYVLSGRRVSVRKVQAEVNSVEMPFGQGEPCDSTLRRPV